MPVVAGAAEEIGQPPVLAGQNGERQPHEELALISGIVHDDDQPLVAHAVPDESEKTIVRPVAVPGSFAREQLPLSVAQYRLFENRQQLLVKLFPGLVDRFTWGTA